MKKVFLASIIFLFASVTLVSMLAGDVHAAPKVVSPTDFLGLGQGACFYDGTFTTYSSKPSCVHVAPPPESNCNPNGIQSSTLDVLHEVRDKVDIGGYASLYLFQSDAGGCGSVWAGVHVDSGCHVITNISITDSTHGNREGGLDANGVLKCGGWESTYMVDGESGSTATATVIVDFQAQQSASVTV